MVTKIELKEDAKNEIEGLFLRAERVFEKNKSLSGRCVRLARKISMKFNVRIPKEFKRKFCKHCYSYLVPGKNLRVRTQKGRVVYTCQECNKFMRFVY